MLRACDLLLTLAAVCLLIASLELKPRGIIIAKAQQQPSQNSSLAIQQPQFGPFVPQLQNFLNPFAAFQQPTANNMNRNIINDNNIRQSQPQQPFNPLQALYEQLPIYQNLLAARQRQEALEAAQRARLQHENRVNQQQQQKRRNSSPRPRTTTTTTTEAPQEDNESHDEPQHPQQQQPPYEHRPPSQPQHPPPPLPMPLYPNYPQIGQQPSFNPFGMQNYGQSAQGQQQPPSPPSPLPQPPPSNALQLQQLYQQLMAARQANAAGQPPHLPLPAQLPAQQPSTGLGGFDPQRAFAAAGLQQPLKNNLLSLLQQQQLQQQQLQPTQLPQLPLAPMVQQPPSSLPSPQQPATVPHQGHVPAQQQQQQQQSPQQPPTSNGNVQFDDDRDDDGVSKGKPEPNQQDNEPNQPASEDEPANNEAGQPNEQQQQQPQDEGDAHGGGGGGGGGGGQQEAAKPEEEDPDLKQFQNLANGGDSFTDLFPPGILSNNDITDIKKQQEEQAKKQEEEERQRYMQRQQQRQQQEQNHKPTNNEDGDQSEENNGRAQDEEQPPSQDGDAELNRNASPMASALTTRSSDKAPSERLTNSPGVVYSKAP